MVNRPQIQGHQDDTVNAGGAPSLNWGMGIIMIKLVIVLPEESAVLVDTAVDFMKFKGALQGNRRQDPT